MSCVTNSLLPQLVFAIDGEACDHAFELDPRLAATLSRRHILLLDTSVWIRLADRGDEQASRTADRLLRLTDAETIICPLTPPTIWELRKQTGESLLRMAELMEQLSENVTFRSLDQLFDSEIESFLSYLLTGDFKPLALNQQFGPLLSYVAPGYRLANSHQALSREGSSHLHQLASSMRLATLVKSLGDQSCPPLSSNYDAMSASRQRRELAGNSLERARRIETESVATRYVIPRLKEKQAEMAISDRIRIAAKINELPKSRRYGSAIEHILRFTPALSAHVEVLTISCLDITRKNSPNDFFDRELMIYALSYAGSFAAIDRWLANLIAQSRKDHHAAFFAFAGSLGALNTLLDGHT